MLCDEDLFQLFDKKHEGEDFDEVELRFTCDPYWQLLALANGSTPPPPPG